MKAKVTSWFLSFFFLFSVSAGSALAADIICWFPPGAKGAQCKAITDALTKSSGLTVTPRVAIGYPEILAAFSQGGEHIVYAGSFVQAILTARKLSAPLAQKIDGKELYAGIFIYPRSGDPKAILQDNAADIAFAQGASSGESCAKAATGGRAALKVKDHAAAVNALKAGKARGAFVKNYWWDDHRAEYPEFAAYEVPGVSERKNPDNVLAASLSLSPAQRERLAQAALLAKDAFGAGQMTAFDAAQLGYTLELMKKGGIDPAAYTWQ